MKIILLDETENAIASDVVAVEMQFDWQIGRFVVFPDGVVRYLHFTDSVQWIAGFSLPQFKSAVAAWDAYLEGVVDSPEQEQLNCVGSLRDALAVLGVLNLGQYAYWTIILEQTEQGLL
ncbi:MAG: hypothetical protein V4484_23435 [Pseudomonadota bacterium]